jgi:hypothetical protein
MSSTRPRRDWQGLQEPDVGAGRGQVDVAHALAAHLGLRDFNAALLADHAAVLQALVLAAQALVVLDRAKDLGAEQAVALGLEGAVVDGLGLLHSPKDQERIFSGEARPIGWHRNAHPA